MQRVARCRAKEKARLQEIMVFPQDIVGDVTAMDDQPFVSINRKTLVRRMSNGTWAGSSLLKVTMRLSISLFSLGSILGRASQVSGGRSFVGSYSAGSRGAGPGAASPRASFARLMAVLMRSMA